MIRPWIKFMKLANALRKVLKKTLHINVNTALQVVGGIVDRATTHEQLVCLLSLYRKFITQKEV